MRTTGSASEFTDTDGIYVFRLYIVPKNVEVEKLDKTYGDLLIKESDESHLAIVAKVFDEGKIDKESLRTGLVALMRHFKILDEAISPKMLIVSRHEFKSLKEESMFEIMIKGIAGLLLSDDEIDKFSVVITEYQEDEASVFE